MTELDTRILRRALAAPRDAPDADTVDIATIVGRGRALRRRRRLAAVAGGACAAAALFGALTAITHLTRPATAPAQYPAVSGRTTPARHPLPSRSPGAVVRTPAPGATPSPAPTAVPETALPDATGPGVATPGPASVARPTTAPAYPSPSPARSRTAVPTARAVTGAPSPTPGR